MTNISTERLVCWTREVALPFWSIAGRNNETGLFHECLDETAVPIPQLPLRVRVQFRQIYTLSHAAVVGWLPTGAAIARDAWDRLKFCAAAENLSSGFAHILTADGQVLDSRRDSYDHAFAVLAASWLWRATGDAAVARDLDAILHFVDTKLTDSFGALIEGLPASLPRRQNPQMHWFEAMLALAEAADRDEGLARADRMRRFMETRLFDPSTFTIGEFFDDAWRPAFGAIGDSVEPGHLVEWTWLLRRHETLAGWPRSPLASGLLESALKSKDSVSGLLVDECDRLGRARRNTRRSWLATELAKAWIAEAEASRPGARLEAEAALAVLDRYHLRRPFPAGWIDQLDADCNPIKGPVPASILYHVFVAVVEANRVLRT